LQFQHSDGDKLPFRHFTKYLIGFFTQSDTYLKFAIRKLTAKEKTKLFRMVLLLKSKLIVFFYTRTKLPLCLEPIWSGIDSIERKFVRGY